MMIYRMSWCILSFSHPSPRALARQVSLSASAQTAITPALGLLRHSADKQVHGHLINYVIHRCTRSSLDFTSLHLSVLALFSSTALRIFNLLLLLLA